MSGLPLDIRHVSLYNENSPVSQYSSTISQRLSPPLLLETWMSTLVTAHRTALGLCLLLVISALGLALLFDWRMDGPPEGAVLVAPASPLAPSAVPPGGPASSGLSPTVASAAHLLKVYITGAVQHPGVYTVNSATRITDLLTAAGG